VEIKTKQRLVGILVLLAILSIFLPVLFHTSRPVAETQLSVKVPLKPPEPSVILPAPQLEQKKPEVVVKVAPKPPEPSVTLPVLNKVPDKAAKTKTFASEQKTRKELSLKSLLTTPEAWVIKVGSFADKANADRLQEKLRHNGFDAYSRSIINAQGKRLQRVYVGPEISLKKVKQLREKLQKTLHINGVVNKYKV